MNYWDRIRAHYKRYRAQIMATPSDIWAIDPYAWEFEAGIRMTPIEARLWHDIRQAGLVMYPQYPVSRFFVDYGNPVAKVAIECDGAKWHQDKAKDAERDEELAELGWMVVRITGRQCHEAEREVEDDEGRPYWQSTEAQDLLREMRNVHPISTLGRGGQRTT